MALKGRAKLGEEIGELGQVLGKIEGMYGEIDKEHWDGKGSLRYRLEEEIADVLAACRFVIHKHGLNSDIINQRYDKKFNLFMHWDADPES